MDFVLSDGGSADMLTVYFGSNDYTLKLFTNDITPLDTHTAASFAEASGGGYAAKTLVFADCTISTVAGIAQAAYPKQSFVFTGPLDTTVGPPAGTVDIYGYYIVNAGGTYIGGARLAAKMTPINNEDTLATTPLLKLSKGTPT